MINNWSEANERREARESRPTEWVRSMESSRRNRYVAARKCNGNEIEQSIFLVLRFFFPASHRPLVVVPFDKYRFQYWRNITEDEAKGEKKSEQIPSRMMGKYFVDDVEPKYEADRKINSINSHFFSSSPIRGRYTRQSQIIIGALNSYDIDNSLACLAHSSSSLISPLLRFLDTTADEKRKKVWQKSVFKHEMRI